MKVMTIAWMSLRRLMRDRLSLFFVILFPALIILLVGVAIFKQQEGGLKVGVVRSDQGPFGAELERQIDRTDLIEVVRFEDPDSLRKAVRRETVISGLIIGREYSTSLRSGELARLEFLVPPGSGTPAAVRSTIAAIATVQGGQAKAARFATEISGGSFERNLQLARSADVSSRLKVERSTVGTSDEFPGGFSYPAASNLVLFVFISSLAGASELILVRQAGISRRMLSTPTSVWTILLGQGMGRFVVALFQGAIIFVLGLALFDVDWGDPLATSALIVGFAAVSTGVSMLMGTVFRTPEQASSIGPPLGIALGMLGGCMWPLEIVSPTMKTIGHLTPHAWAMDGFIDVLSRSAGIGDIASKIGVLAIAAGVLMTVSTLRLRHAITR